jgi:hypothetical protein
MGIRVRFGHVGSDGFTKKSVDSWLTVNRVQTGTGRSEAAAWQSHRLWETSHRALNRTRTQYADCVSGVDILYRVPQVRRHSPRWL